MKKIFILLLMLIMTALVLSGCGESVGGPQANVVDDKTTQPAKATVQILTTGALPSGTVIGGIDVTVSLAPGVSVKSAANPPETDAGAVAMSGVAASNSTFLATYSAATGTQSGKVRLLLGNTGGFGTGEFATINGDIAAGKNPKADDFTITDFSATDLNGVDISGLTAGLTVDIK